MNNENNLDKKIKTILSKDANLTDKYKYMIRNTLKENKNKSKTLNSHFNNFIKFAAVGSGCMILTTSVVFAKDISNFFTNFFNNSKGIDTAVENGYLLEPNMKYVDSSEVETKVENLLITDYNLSFTMDMKFKNNLDFESIEKINLPDLMITDNENKILYCENEEKFNKFSSEKNLNYTYKEFNDNYINSGCNYYIKAKDPNSNEIQLVYNLTADNFPKSKNINISFSEIDLLNQTDINNSQKVAGNWNMNVDIPEKFYNRENITYKVKSCSNENINITQAVVYDTGMKLELVIRNEKIYNDEDSQENINLKVNDRLEELKKEFASGNETNLKLFDNNTYVETEDGTKYYPSESSSEDSGYSNDFMNGTINYWQTYNLTKYQASPTLKLVLNYKGEEITIELEEQ